MALIGCDFARITLIASMSKSEIYSNKTLNPSEKSDAYQTIVKNHNRVIKEIEIKPALFEMKKCILEEESEHLMELMGSTSGDTDRFLNEIKNNFEQVKLLREKLQIAKISAESDNAINSELERLEKMFTDTDVSFNEYDDVIVRRLIECVRVLKENKIIVILKGGFQAEENLI